MTRRPAIGRSLIAAWGVAVVLLAVVGGTAFTQEPEHPLVGRWVVEAEPGGAVWAFQSDGSLILTGPGEIVSEGTWSAAAEPGAFDAEVDVAVSGQTIKVLGQLSDDGSTIALYVVASDATAPDDWTPWPAESRLLGTPLGMMTGDTPEPTVPPVDCLRPRWVDGAVDWDRCDEALTPA